LNCIVNIMIRNVLYKVTQRNLVELAHQQYFGVYVRVEKCTLYFHYFAFSDGKKHQPDCKLKLHFLTSTV
jgi:hypothetical protein